MFQTNQELYSARQAAKLLGISVKTIRRWAQLKKLKGLKVGTRGDWRFTKNNLMKLINNKE